jgi:hypothetical protein
MGPVVAFLLGGIVSYVGKKPINKVTKRVMKGAIVAGRSVKGSVQGIAHGITEDWDDARAELDDAAAKPSRPGAEQTKTSSPADNGATSSPKSP